jgi:hypothetical protein
MAYATSGDAGFRIATDGLSHNNNSLSGGLYSSHEKIVEREAIKSEEENNPTARPVDAIDCRVLFRVLALSDVISEAAAAGNCVTSFKAADGGSGSVTHGPMVAGGYVHTAGRNQGGHNIEQEFLHQGTALTETISI